MKNQKKKAIESEVEVILEKDPALHRLTQRHHRRGEGIDDEEEVMREGGMKQSEKEIS